MYREQRSKLHNILCTSQKLKRYGKRENLVNVLVTKFNCAEDLSKIERIKTILNANFFHKYFPKWQQSHRINTHFTSTNETWLREDVIFDLNVSNNACK